METTSGAGAVSLPTGGGALTSVGERFQPDPVRGTGSYGVPIVVPAGPGQVRPSLSLRYSTAQGTGPFGLGWRLAGPMTISRRTDRGVPAYTDDDEFVLSGAETLVPVGGGRYRPRSDTQGWQISRDGDTWTVRTKEGRRFSLGATPASRVSGPAGTLTWLVDDEQDPGGTGIAYRWRVDAGTAYLDEVSWGPFDVRFGYSPREDVTTSCRAGFEQAIALRCHAIERHTVTEAASLAARYVLEYAPVAPRAGADTSLLQAVRLEGVAADGTVETYPPVVLGYRELDLGRQPIRAVAARGTPPPSLDDERAALVDLDGDGLPDLVETGVAGHLWWPNLGDGSFGPYRRMPLVPAGLVLGQRGVTFADLDGNGTADLVRATGHLGVAAVNTGAGGWASRPAMLAGEPPLDLASTSSRLVDLDGDGVPDLLASTRGGFLVSFNQGRDGWTTPRFLGHGPAGAPPVALDQTGVHLADLNGDGLTDIVVIASGRAEYWPSWGGGRFGQRVVMAHPPLLPPHHDPERISLVDVDGDGAADLVYRDDDRVLVWLNRSGRSWADPVTIDIPPVPGRADVSLVDLLGTGTPGLLWSGRPRAGVGLGTDTGYRFAPLTGEAKPYLLTSIDDGFGATTTIAYTTSSAERRRDAEAGQPWGTFLPFPLHVVSEIVRTDRATGRVDRTRMRYHRGHYDGVERELRGFEQVEQVRDGDASCPDLIQVMDFAQGSGGDSTGSTDGSAAERAMARALSGAMVRMRTLERRGADAPVLRQDATTVWEAHEEFAGSGPGGRAAFVHVPRLVSTTASEVPAQGRVRVQRAEYAYDDSGNLVRRLETSRFEAPEPGESDLVVEQRVSYARGGDAWLVGLPATIETRDGTGRLLRRELRHYDGPDFVGLPLGQADRGVLRRQRELVLVGAELPAGYAGEIDPGWGLVAEGATGSADWYRDTAAYAHDSHGNVVAQRDPAGGVTRIEYDEAGLFPLRQTDPLGHQTTSAFDPRSAQPTRLRLPDGRVTEYVVSPLGRLRAQLETASDGLLALTQAYACQFARQVGDQVVPARVTSARPRGPGRSPTEFGDDVDPATITDASVAVDHYDADGQLLEQLVRREDAADGAPRWVARERRTMNVRGKPAVEHPNRWRSAPDYVPPADADVTGGVRYEFDVLGQLLRAVRPDGTSLRVRFLGDRVDKRDAGTADAEPATVEVYDAAARLVAVEQPVGDGTSTVTRYARDGLGRVVAITDASGRESVRYHYAGPGPAIRITHADAGERSYWRDGRGNLVLRTDGLGRRLVTDYDPIGRMTRVLDATGADAPGAPADPQVVRRLEYDGTLLRSVTEGSEGTAAGVRTEYDYDAAARTTSTRVKVGGETLRQGQEYSYDGHLRAVTQPDGTVLRYRTGPSSLVTGVEGSVGGSVVTSVEGVDYDEYASPRSVALAGGCALSFEFDPAFRRLVGAQLHAPGGAGAGLVRGLGVEYDVNGNVTSIVDSMPDGVTRREFDYDALYRVTASRTRAGDGSLLRADTFSYNGTGDVLENSESLDGTCRYDDPAHAGRLTGFATAGAGQPSAVGYDGAGRATSHGGLTALTYDLYDRLVSAVAPDGSRVTFVYDHHGSRIRKTVAPLTGPVAHTDTLGDFERGPGGVRVAVRLGGLLVATLRTPPGGGASEVHYLLVDHLGSILATCDRAGNPLAQQAYSAFGVPLQGGGGGAEDRYLGIAPDGELGLAQFGARMYSAVTGRFVTPDWFIIEDPSRSLRTPQGLNAYAYALNNPLALRDPSGLWFGIDDAIAAAVGFVVGFVAGVIHGAVNGQSFGDCLLNGLEGGLLGAVGGWLAWNTFGLAAGAFAAGGFLGVTGGVLLSAAAVGIFVNSIASGAMQIYDWGSWTGWASFLVDYSWGLVGTALGGLLITTNLFYGSGAKYQEGLSRRQNRHVYDGGFGFGTFAFTQGNVVSNLDGRHGDLLDHEGLHTFQSRLFGPIFQATYVAWLAVGAVLAVVIFGPIAAANGESYGGAIMDVAYRDNPWEAWAYCSENPTPGGRGGMFSYAC
ncbi:MAG: toxin TcdB middle/N-terminal domain-containing protein [Angustibacter sp.]